jgi:hypothetical protein
VGGWDVPGSEDYTRIIISKPEDVYRYFKILESGKGVIHLIDRHKIYTDPILNSLWDNYAKDWHDWEFRDWNRDKWLLPQLKIIIPHHIDDSTETLSTITNWSDELPAEDYKPLISFYSDYLKRWSENSDAVFRQEILKRWSDNSDAVFRQEIKDGVFRQEIKDGVFRQEIKDMIYGPHKQPCFRHRLI